MLFGPITVILSDTSIILICDKQPWDNVKHARSKKLINLTFSCIT